MFGKFFGRVSFVVLAAMVFFVAGGVTVVGAVNLSPPGKNFVDIDPVRNMISVKLVNIDIADVAKAIAQQGDINVFLDENLKIPLTAKFANMPLELGIKRLLGPISSSFIFVEKKGVDGKSIFKMETVKIFKQGNMLAANYVNYSAGKTVMGNVSGKSVGAGKSVRGGKGGFGKPGKLGKTKARTPGAIRHAIIEAHENLSMLRRKAQMETAHVNERIADLKRQLSDNPPAEERSGLVKSLGTAENQLVRTKNLNSRLIIEEEKNVRELVAAQAKALTPQQITERQQLMQRQQRSQQQQQRQQRRNQ